MKRAMFVLLLVARTAAAEPVGVKVTEIAGGVAYITPGRAAGIVPGTKIKLRGKELVVTDVTEKTAAVKLDKLTLAVGDSGTADVTREAAGTATVLAKPRPPDAFAGKWGEPVLPATQQTPTPVPLGSGTKAGRARVTVIGHGFGGVARGERPAGEAEARVIASYDVLIDRPLAVDLDVAGRAFSSGIDSRTRVPVLVRTAQIRYGSIDDPSLALGRLRFAATSVGMLDGARAAAHVGVFELAAFGGLVPDPLGGKPDTGASRFGAEVGVDARDAAWQPRVALTAYGSTWDGRLDERRLSLVASTGHDALWFDGWAETQQFEADNPWGARSLELTGAGGAAEYRKHGRHVGLDVTFLRPERSMRLAAALPAAWLCTLAPAPGDTDEPCSGSDYWVSGSASAGVRTERWALDAVGTAGRSHGLYRGFDSSAYVRGEVRVAGVARVIAGGSAGRASFASWTAAEVGSGAALTRKLDVLALYRPELLDYVASEGPVLVHSLVLDGHYAVLSSLDVALSALATTGADRDAVALLTTIVWRPL
jgi:hypothetical protein